MTGKLIIIEAVDGSGKATQAGKLYGRLQGEGYRVRLVEYPDYKGESSALVRMYLRGDFGKKPGDVNPYAASIFYTVDRYASYKKAWERFYQSGGIVLADRYTTSNMVHQGAKIRDRVEKEKYLAWLWHLEFKIYQLPVPDSVIFLDMPVHLSHQLMEGRANKITGEKEKDIHEKSRGFLVDSYENACYLAGHYGWHRVMCGSGSGLKSIEEIHQEVYRAVKEVL